MRKCYVHRFSPQIQVTAWKATSICFILGEVIGFQVLLDSFYPRNTRASVIFVGKVWGFNPSLFGCGQNRGRCEQMQSDAADAVISHTDIIDRLLLKSADSGRLL